MVDFFPLLSRAIEELDPNTLERRQVIYERARQLVEGNLQARVPPLSTAEVASQRQTLEEAIWKIEMNSAVSAPLASVHPYRSRMEIPRTNAAFESDDLDFQSMKYVQRVLQPGEKVLTRGRYHWIIYIPPIVYLLLSALAFSQIAKVTPDNKVLLAIVAPCLLLSAAISALNAWFRQWTTEIAVTNLRIVRKTGFIRRKTWEMNMDKVESVTVDQGVIGRILNYGTIHVLGTGEGVEHIHKIRAPIELRNRIVAR